MITHSIIVAAGMGTRLRDLTATCPKGLIKVSGDALVPRLLRQMARAGVSHTKIVVGFLGEKLIEEVRSGTAPERVEFLKNPQYHSSNNITSLHLALAPARRVVISDCDVYLSEFPREWLQPDGSDLGVPTRPLRDGETGTVLRPDSSGRLHIHVVRNPHEIIAGDRKAISIYLIKSDELAQDLYREIGDAVSCGRTDLYYEEALAKAVGSKYRIAEHRTEGSGVTAFEIDTPRDLRDAESWFAARCENIGSSSPGSSNDAR